MCRALGVRRLFERRTPGFVIRPKAGLGRHKSNQQPKAAPSFHIMSATATATPKAGPIESETPRHKSSTEPTSQQTTFDTMSDTATATATATPQPGTNPVLLGQQQWCKAFADQCHQAMERRTRKAQGQTNILAVVLFLLKKYGYTHWAPLEKCLHQMKLDEFCVSEDDFKQKVGCSRQAAFNAATVFIADCAKHDDPSKGYEMKHLDELAHALVRHGVPELYEHLLKIGAVSVQLLMLMAVTKPKLKSLAHKADPNMPDHVVDRIMDFARTLKREYERQAAENMQRLAVQQHKELKRRRDADATESDDDEEAVAPDEPPTKRQAVDEATSS